MDNIAEIIKARQPRVKPPAYQWQDLALKVLKDLSVPDFKRSAVFKVCRDYDQILIQRALTDTLECCQTGSKWQYFFKIIDKK